MKLSERILSPWPLLWIYPLLLVIPNVWLALSEPWALLSKLTGIVLPLGLYYVVMGLCRRSGLAVLLSLPVAVLCAFQIVLLYLYGESIIAIDMFMNVATTNVGEVTELLSNLWKAIATVLVLYLPPLALGVYLLMRGRCAEAAQLRHARVAGITLVSVGLALAAGAYSTADRYSMRRELFPLNVVCNLCEAVNRVNQAEGYFDSSRNFRFHAVSLRSDSVPEVYVLVIGETSRADNWQLFGYDRPNNPRLSVRDGLLCLCCCRISEPTISATRCTGLKAFSRYSTRLECGLCFCPTRQRTTRISISSLRKPTNVVVYATTERFITTMNCLDSCGSTSIAAVQAVCS